MWNDLPYAVFDTGTLAGCVYGWSQPLVASSGAGACWVAKAIITNFVFHTIGPVLLILIIIIIIIIMIIIVILMQ